VVAPSLNITVPVAAEGDTVAVNTTLLPKSGEVEEAESTKVVAATATETETPELVLVE
jgi:hypothetical protein